VELSWGEDMTWPTTIEIWEPNQHLRWADEIPPGPDGAPVPKLAVDWFISTDAGQTVLRLVHSGFGEEAKWDDQIDGLAGGWKYFLWYIAMCLTRHAGVHRVMVSSRRKSAVSRQALWASIFSSGLVTLSDDRARCRLTLGGQVFDGVVETLDAERRFAATVSSLSDALLFIELEGSKPDKFHVGFWLSTYGVDAATTDALQRSVTEQVGKLVEPEVTATL
jgi:hypothetical protein